MTRTMRRPCRLRLYVVFKFCVFCGCYGGLDVGASYSQSRVSETVVEFGKICKDSWTSERRVRVIDG